MPSPLERLVRSGREIEEGALADVLEPYVTLTEEGGLIPTRRLRKLDSEGKVIAVLLGVKALHVLGKRESDEAGPSEIAELGGIASGTVKRTVRELAADGILRGNKGSYSVPSHSFEDAVEALKGRAEDA